MNINAIKASLCDQNPLCTLVNELLLSPYLHDQQCDQGVHVEVSSIQEFKSALRFDGIWACASLLHIPYSDLPRVFTQLSELLEGRGVIYCSFKYGDSETVRGERKFTDLNEKLLADSLPSTLRVSKLWLTEDLRTNREDKWLNVILVRHFS